MFYIIIHLHSVYSKIYSFRWLEWFVSIFRPKVTIFSVYMKTDFVNFLYYVSLQFNSTIQIPLHDPSQQHSTPLHSDFYPIPCVNFLREIEAVCMQMENKWICWQLIIFTKCRIRYLFSVITVTKRGR